MSSYPVTIRRCQHIKVNGTQCASPALRDEKHCYFHAQWRRKSTEVRVNVNPNVNANTNHEDHATFTLPTLEDANSIQLGLAKMLRLLATHQIDHKTAGLMLYALQTASANLRKTLFEPEPTRVVIDRECVERRPIGASARGPHLKAASTTTCWRRALRRSPPMAKRLLTPC
jgi:23S rRNA-/tRNA-specific pseudouridylate synthase